MHHGLTTPRLQYIPVSLQQYRRYPLPSMFAHAARRNVIYCQYKLSASDEKPTNITDPIREAYLRRREADTTSPTSERLPTPSSSESAPVSRQRMSQSRPQGTRALAKLRQHQVSATFLEQFGLVEHVTSPTATGVLEQQLPLLSTASKPMNKKRKFYSEPCSKLARLRDQQGSTTPDVRKQCMRQCR